MPWGRTLPAIVGFVLVLASVLVIAAEPEKKAKPAVPVEPIVSIRKSDGSTLRCKLVNADGAFLMVRPAEGTTFGEPVELAWSDVKTVSNGLTRKKALDKWKADHKDELCGDCKGDFFVACDVCKGVGHDPAASKDCKTCKGEMTVACKQPKCDHGKIPCLASCIKKDGAYRFKNLTVNVHPGHEGEVIKSDGKGGITLVPCTACGHTAKITCPTCHGRSIVPCPTCKSNKTAADCTACPDGQTLCRTCNGSGIKDKPRSALPTATTGETKSDPPSATPKPEDPAPAKAPTAADGF